VRIDDVRFASLGPGVGGFHEAQKQWVWTVGPRLELGVGLGANEKRVIGNFDELDQSTIR
jgi:hypothetical protein